MAAINTQNPPSGPSTNTTKDISAAVVSQQSDNVTHALAGAGGGLLSMVLTYPLITLSTRAQVESKSAADSEGKNTSTLAAARKIIEREGLSGLYAGLESALFGISVTNFVYYYWYEWSRSGLTAAAVKKRGSSQLTTIESMAAGALAGCATVFITNPIWVVNTRMTTNRAAAESKSEEKGALTESAPTRPAPKSTIATFLEIIRTEGFSRLFAGVIPALVLVSNPILQYTFFEQMKSFLLARRQKSGAKGSGSITPLDSFVLGALGKLLATTVTYPYITIKSRMHVAKASPDGSKTGTPSPGVIQSLVSIVRKDGWSGLYAGIGPKLTQSVLTAAFLFAFKDFLYDAVSKLTSARQKRLAGR